MLNKAKKTLHALYVSGPFWNMMGSGMVAASTVLLTMLVSRFSDLTTVRAFTLALTTAQILYSLGLFGANDLQMTDYQHKYRFADYFAVKLLSTLLSLICCAVAVFAMGISADGRVYTWLLTAYFMVHSVGEMYQAMFFQNGRLDLSGKANFFRYFLSTVGFSAALIAGGSVAAACAVMLAVNIISTWWWDLRPAPRFRDSGYAMQREPCLRLMRTAFPLCLSLMSSLILINCPKYIVNANFDEAVQGLYSLLFMPTYTVSLLGMFIYRPFFPKYSRLIGEDRKGFSRLLISHIALIIGIAVGCAGLFRAFGVPFMKLLFGRDLTGSEGLMALFMVAGGMMAANQLLYYIMVILRRQRAVLFIYLAGTLLSMAAGLVLIPRFALTGAWITFAVGQLALAAGYIAVLGRSLRQC